MSFYYSRVEDKVLDLAMYLQANSFLPPFQINMQLFQKIKRVKNKKRETIVFLFSSS